MKLEAFPPQARTKQLLGQLFAVWLASVRATHTFLTEEEIQAIAPQVPDALAQVPTLVVAWEGEEPAGFLGVDGQWIEMLFLAPPTPGPGAGAAAAHLWGGALWDPAGVRQRTEPPGPGVL